MKRSYTYHAHTNTLLSHFLCETEQPAQDPQTVAMHTMAQKSGEKLFIHNLAAGTAYDTCITTAAIQTYNTNHGTLENMNIANCIAFHLAIEYANKGKVLVYCESMCWYV